MAASQADKDAYKLMRRGTRACRECRRRKIKCIYDDEKDDVCQECAVHDRQCVKQGVVRGNTNSQSTRSVKIQVTRLESAIEKLTRERLRGNGDGNTANDSPSHRDLCHEEKELAAPDKPFERKSPVFSLFNNDLFHQKGTLEAYATEFSGSVSFPDPRLSDKEKLLSTITNIPNVFSVLEFASEWWVSWREQHYILKKTINHRSLQDFVRNQLESDSPVAVSLGLMAIAMALGQVRPGLDDITLNLPVPANHIMNYILAAIDQIVCDSTQYLAQKDSILLFMMRAKHHTENNQLRKAWLRIRQGIRCAQAIGFGAAGPNTIVVTDEEAEQQRFVAAIFELDHFVSMVLGLPYAKDPNFTDARAFAVLLAPGSENEWLKLRALRRIIAVMAGHVNDRNAEGTVNIEIAESLQATLNMAAGAMPQGWWNLPYQQLTGPATDRHESVMVQMWFWTVQSYLHLPYLIKPSETGSSARYRQLCLQGARNAVRSFCSLRTEPATSVYMCNCDDFQALLGTCMLLVGILQDESTDAPAPQLSPIGIDAEADLNLIEEVKDIFRYRSQEQGGGISKQGLAVLEELTCFLYEEEDSETTDNESSVYVPRMNASVNKHEKTIMLPYFGTIQVELTKKIPKRKMTNSSQNMLPTPPRSVEGSLADNSPDQQLQPDFSPFQGYQNQFDGLSGNHPLLPYYTDTLNQYSGNDSSTFIPCSSMLLNESSISNPNWVPPIAWDQWENYMFDQELEQDWNPGLQHNNNFFTN